MTVEVAEIYHEGLAWPARLAGRFRVRILMVRHLLVAELCGLRLALLYFVGDRDQVFQVQPVERRAFVGRILASRLPSN